MNTDQENSAANRATKALVVLIGVPVVLITVGYLVSVPIWLVLAALGFDPASHSAFAWLIRVVILACWLGGSWWLVRRMWPR